jgi:D-alanine-D-alanine ligase
VRVGIAYTLAPGVRVERGPDDRFEEFDSPETVEAIARVLEADGHDVVLLGDGREFLVKVLDDRPDFVFNFAEGEGVGRNREARVPAVLEMLGIPHTGSDPFTLSATLDKDVAKRLVRDVVAVPRDVLIGGAGSHDPDVVRMLLEAEFGLPLPCPVILKPSLEGSSKGIRGHCVTDDADEVVDRVRDLGKDYDQPILIEEYIDGDEVTVGLIGNGPDATVLGTMRILPRASEPRFVYSLEVKRDWKRRVAYEAPAQLPEAIARQLELSARISYQALQCRDVARIDFRIARDGTPYFLEANPLPGLSPVTSDLVFLAHGHGITHEDLIRKILGTALMRYGLPALSGA